VPAGDLRPAREESDRGLDRGLPPQILPQPGTLPCRGVAESLQEKPGCAGQHGSGYSW
jgi:hypothetical protein